ncbi:MAG: hypothetical protein R3Y67_03140 [Eubacteriales bacterium]
MAKRRNKYKKDKKIQCDRVVVYLDRSESVERVCKVQPYVNERISYMADYIWDETGNLSKTNYDAIT